MRRIRLLLLLWDCSDPRTELENFLLAIIKFLQHIRNRSLNWERWLEMDQDQDSYHLLELMAGYVFGIINRMLSNSFINCVFNVCPEEANDSLCKSICQNNSHNKMFESHTRSFHILIITTVTSTRNGNSLYIHYFCSNIADFIKYKIIQKQKSICVLYCNQNICSFCTKKWAQVTV